MRALIPLFTLASLLFGCVIESADEAAGSGGGEPALGCVPGDTRLADDGCNTCACQADGGWVCTQLACAAACEVGEVRAPGPCTQCVCEADGWRCEDACPDAGFGCEPGARWMEDECRECTCDAQGEARCEDTCETPPLANCPPDCDTAEPGGACEDGALWLADDGCNSCTCLPDGTELCSEVPGCNGTEEDPGRDHEQFACETDDDCRPTGCNQQLCAAQPIDECDDASVNPCFSPDVTRCGCVEGRCAWAATAALNGCLGAP